MNRDVLYRGSARAGHNAWKCSAKGCFDWDWPPRGPVLPVEFVIPAAQLPAREHFGKSPFCSDIECSTLNTFQVERRNGILGSVKTIMEWPLQICCSLCRNFAVNHSGLPATRQKQIWKVSAFRLQIKHTEICSNIYKNQIP